MTFAFKLERPVSDRGYIPVIDGLRFIAIFGVLLLHSSEYLFHKADVIYNLRKSDTHLAMGLAAGTYGVHLFFIISGFILSLPFVKRELTTGKAYAVDRPFLKGYYLRRLTRIEPPYILCMTAFFLLLVLRPTADVVTLTKSYFSSLLYSHAIVFGGASYINVVTWSLEAEIQFYLLLPFLMHGLAKIPLALRGKVLLGLTLFWVFILPYVYSSKFLLVNYLQYFLLGIFFAHCQPDRWRASKWGGLAFWGGILLLVYINGFMTQKVPGIKFLVLAAFVGIFWGAFTSPLVRVWLAYKPITIIGTMCYSIYLLHYGVISLVGPMFMPAAGFAQGNYAIAFVVFAVPVFVSVLSVSTVYYVLCERPFMVKAAGSPRKFYTVEWSR